MLYSSFFLNKRGYSAPVNAPSHSQDDKSANFVSFKLTIAQTSTKSLGVVANQFVKKGETLVIYGGGFVDREHLGLIPKAVRPFFFQVADSIWFGHGFDDMGLGIAEQINHSCNPSAGFRGIAEVISLRDIRQWDPVTIDYSSIQSVKLEGSEFECKCGSSNCRRQVSVDDWKQVTSSNPLLPYMQPFLQYRIDPNASVESASFAKITFPSNWCSPGVDDCLQSTLVSGSIQRNTDGSAKANATIRKGEVIFFASGKIIHKSDLTSAGQSIHAHKRHLSDNFFVQSRRGSDIDPSQIARVNDPLSNVVIRLGHMFVAIREIRSGEEIFLPSDNSQSIMNPKAENLDTIDWSVAGGLPAGYRSGALQENSPHPANLLSTDHHTLAASLREHEISTSTSLARMTQRTMKLLGSFIKGAVLEEWKAAPIAFVGSATSTLTTALCVAGVAPAFERLFGSIYSSGYIAATSTTAIVLGYASYCLFYYGGMLIKERADLLDEAGKLSKELLKRKWEVLKWDFLLHLPSDGYWAVCMFGVQGGLYATGATDLFWSIVAAQGLSDVYYSLREPFYWRAAKKYAEWRMRRAQTANEPANSDTAQLTVEDKVGNA